MRNREPVARVGRLRTMRRRSVLTAAERLHVAPKRRAYRDFA